MLVQPVPLVLQREPEHPRLQQYIVDNPEVVVVGLDWVTEFQKEGERSFYHCSLQPCKNEQGNSRQMMQHLHRLHHVAGWLQEHGHVDLPPQQSLQKVEQLRKSKKDVQGKVRVIADADRWSQAKKARLRLSKAMVDSLFSEVDQSEPSGTRSTSVQESHPVDKDLEKGSKQMEEVKVEPLKKEEGPKDLLRAPQEENVLIETQVAANPEYRFRANVARKVKNVLLNFYAVNPDDTVDKHGNPKEIKIKTSEEFTMHARNLSKQFEAEIAESYIAFHGSREGIEKEKIDTYFDHAHMDNEVRKYFSRL